MDSDQKILIVDDEPLSLRVLSEYLGEAGLAYETAENGREALKKLEAKPSNYAVAIMDRIMPYLSGIEVVKQMQASEELKKIPVIMLTGLSEKEDIIDAVQAGVFDYLTKPVEKDLLVKLIEKALSF